jgi:hypothetical protein
MHQGKASYGLPDPDARRSIRRKERVMTQQQIPLSPQTQAQRLVSDASEARRFALVAMLFGILNTMLILYGDLVLRSVNILIHSL